MTAYRSLASWRGEGPFGAWLTRIAVRIALRQVGQRRSVRWLDPSAEPARPSGDPASAASDAQAIAASPRTDPAMLAVRAEREADAPCRRVDASRAVSRDGHAALLR